MNKLSRSGAAFLFLLSLTACSTVTPDEALLRLPKEGRKFERRPIAATTLPTHFPYIRDMAVLSELAYDRGTPLETRRPLQLDENLRAKAEKALAEDPDAPRRRQHRAVGQLEYGVYVDRTSSPKFAAIAFRGTDSKIDHFTNFRWFTFWVLRTKDQYEQTALIVPYLVEEIKADLGADATIVSTGHSLGGGLAQTAGYVACNDIDAVYAFDPSPVTHHRAQRGMRCPDERDVFRIYEDTEILALSRIPLRLTIGLSDADPRITEAKVHLLPSKWRGHSMAALATAFVELFP